jgi:2-oxoglutarate dehydrogenase complex dehydrogenase (E1) component-like enzyme
MTRAQGKWEVDDMAGTNAMILEAIQKLESKIDCLGEKIQKLERDNVKNENVAEVVDDHEKRLRELEKLAPAMKAVIWIAGVLGLSIIGLIWGLITGTITLVFK